MFYRVLNEEPNERLQKHYTKGALYVFLVFFFFFHERGGRTGEYWPDVVEVRENKETDPFRGDGPYCKIPTENQSIRALHCA